MTSEDTFIDALIENMKEERKILNKAKKILSNIKKKRTRP